MASLPQLSPLPRVLDATMLTAFRACPTKFYHEFCQGLRGRPSVHLHAGACFASALEHARVSIWKHGRSVSDALLRAEPFFRAEWGDFELTDYEAERSAKTPDRVWEAIMDYFATYPPKSDVVQPYFNEGVPTFEYTFGVPLDGAGFPEHPSGGPFIYGGRVDTLGVYGTTKIPVFMDEKMNSAKPGRDWAEKWNMRGQFIGYAWALRQLGVPVQGVVVRGITVLKTIFHQIETPPITIADFLVSRWYDQLRVDLTRMVGEWHDVNNNWKSGFSLNFGDTCTAFNKPCAFMNACSSHDPNTWLTGFETRHWNPLNRNPEDTDATEPTVG